MKIIDRKIYCAKGQELCETMCKGKDCNRIFVDSLTNNSIDDNNMVKYIPTTRNNVRACFNVNECGYALCVDCYTKLLLNDSNSVGERKRKRRISN